MLKRRLIPVLFLRDGLMVRSERFAEHQIIGSPYSHVERMNQWDVDELIVLDISASFGRYDAGRDDHKIKSYADLLEFTEAIASACRIPLTLGGGIRALKDVADRIRHGADKVTLNTALAEEPRLAREAAREFGSQAVIASIDYRLIDGRPQVVTHHAKTLADATPAQWAVRAQDLGAGEILLNAVDRDGSGAGYDFETIGSVVDAVGIPVIACGGAGHPLHFLQCFERTQASAVAAGNIFHFTENSYPRAKQLLGSKRADVRCDGGGGPTPRIAPVSVTSSR